MINEREAAIDTEIANASAAYSKAESRVDFYRKHTTGWNASGYLADAEADFAAARTALETAAAKYEGWPRFFLVNASNGHIHASMHCSTCFLTTSFSWLPGLSGLTEADAVAEYGGILCSVCFPSAPSDWTEGVNKKDADRKAAEAALKAIAKTPEGRAVKSKSELVARHAYRLAEMQKVVKRAMEESDPPAWVVKDALRFDVEIPKTAKKLARAEEALAAANEALEAALAS